MKLKDRALCASISVTAGIWTAAMYGGCLKRTWSRLGMSTVPQIGLWAASRQGLASDREKQLMMVGFGLSSLGDVNLGLQKEALQIPGFLAFLVAQAVNTAAFAQRTPFGARKAPFVVYLSVASAYVAWLWPRIKDPVMRSPAAVYAFSIALMAAQAAAAWMDAPNAETARYWKRSAIGGALQFVSDGVLGYNFFVEKLPAGDALVMAPYWTSQLLHASSLK